MLPLGPCLDPESWATSGGKTTLAGPLAALIVLVLATNMGSFKISPKSYSSSCGDECGY
jgi:hypothetical protein